MAEREWDDSNWSTGDTLTAQQFADHVTEGHFPSDELQFTINTNGNPAFVDPQNGDAEVLTYDRSAGTWVLGDLDADSATVTNAVDAGSVAADALEASAIISNAVYQSPSDIPAEYEETGNAAYTESDGLVVFE